MKNEHNHGVPLLPVVLACSSILVTSERICYTMFNVSQVNGCFGLIGKKPG
jgi:hypothetical protein